MRGREKCPRCTSIVNVGWQHDPEWIGCYRCGWRWMQAPGAQQELFNDPIGSYIGGQWEFESMKRRPEFTDLRKRT